jgi:uncharacterized DUF497 family protein
MQAMRYTWDEQKRQINLKKHGLDFADAERIFLSPMALVPDKREDYGERRMIGFGLLDTRTVVLVHVERGDDEIRIISLRKADRDETDFYYQSAGYF